MSGLLYKYFISDKVTLIVYGIIYLVCNAFLFVLSSLAAADGNVDDAELEASFLVSVLLFAVIVYCIYLAYPDGLMRPDERHAWTNFSIASPLGHAGQIRSIYYYQLIRNIVFLCWAFLTDTVNVAILGTTAASVSAVLCLITAIGLTFTALELPFLARFGAASGNWIKGLILLVLALIGGVYALFGDISMFFEGDIVESIMNWLSTEGSAEIITVILGAALPLYYLSYRISVNLYRKGVENYEN